MISSFSFCFNSFDNRFLLYHCNVDNIGTGTQSFVEVPAAVLPVFATGGTKRSWNISTK